MKFKQNENGSALIVTLLVFAVLSILGVVILGLSTAEHRFALHQGRKMQAYYVARAGAEATADYILKNPDELAIEDFVWTVVPLGYTAPQTLGSGTYSVDVESIGGGIDHLVVRSEGIVNGVEQNVSLLVDRRAAFENAIFANDTLTLASGASVEDGNVEAGTEVIFENPSNTYVDGTVTFPSDTHYDQVPFPDLPEYLPDGGDWTVGNVTTTLSNDPSDLINYRLEYEYNKITVSPNGKIIFDLVSDMVIRVEEMELNGAIEVVRPGGSDYTLKIYVNKSVEFKGEVLSPPASLFVAVGSNADYIEGSEYNGYVWMQTGNASFHGYVYCPNGQVDIKANLNLYGALVANDCDASSGAVTTYDSTAPLIMPEYFGIPSIGFKMGNWID